MSLFSKAGEKFEEAKQSFMAGKDAEYVCRSCEEPAAEDYDHCPHCGENSIESVESSE